MRTHQQLLSVLVGVVCMAVLVIGALSTPAAAQPSGPTLTISGGAGGNQFVVAPEAASFKLPPRQRLDEPAMPEALLVNEGFEGTWPAANWQLVDQSNGDGGEYLWGKRNCSPRTGQFAIFSHGGGAQGSARACGSQYPNNMQTWAVYGPVNLSNATAATLSFYIRGVTQSVSSCASDGLGLGISTDGSSFNGPAVCGGSTTGPDGNGYTRLSLNLSSLIGQPQLWLAFIFYSNASVTNIGYTVDDVVLDVTTSGGATNTPTNTATPTGSPTGSPTPTRTPGTGPDLRRYIPIAVKVALPTNTPTPTVTPQPGKPKDGHWTGQTTQSEDVSFDITSNGTAYNNFSIGANSGGCGVTIEISGSNGPLQLSNGRISLSGSGPSGGSYSIAGQFSSSKNANGTFTFSSFNLGGGCVINASGTWTATIP